MSEEPDKGSRMAKLPSNDIAPLVKLQWQVTMPPNPFRKIWVHDSFTCGTNCNRNFQLGLTRLSNPSNLQEVSQRTHYCMRH